MRISVYAYQSSPGALADERADLGAAKVPRHGVTAGTRKLVDNHDLRSEDRAERRREVRAFARGPIVHERAAQVIDDVIRGLAAAVEALHEHRYRLADLGEVAAIQ